MAAWAWALHHFFFLPSGTVCLSYVLLGKKIEFCFKSGYFQMDCVQLCDQVTRCSTISWVAEQWTREDGRDGWLALKVGTTQLRWVRFSDASWLEWEPRDCSSRGHPRPVSGAIPPQFVTLTLDFATVTEGVTDMSAPVQIMQSWSVLGICRPWCNLLWITWHEMYGYVFCFMTQTYIHTWLCFYCRWVLSRSVSAEKFLEDCPTDICKINYSLIWKPELTFESKMWFLTADLPHYLNLSLWLWTIGHVYVPYCCVRCKSELQHCFLFWF